MNKALMGIALAAMLAVPGIALAQSFDVEGMTQEQKDLRVAKMELRQSMLQDRIELMKGTITQDELQERQQEKMQQMQQLKEQLHLLNSENGDCQMGNQKRQAIGNGNGSMGISRMGW